MALIVLGLLITVLLLFRPSIGTGTPNHDYSYSRFVRAVTNDKVRSATIDSNGKVTGSLKNGDDYTSQIPTALRDLRLAPLLSEHHVQVTGKGPPGTSLLSILLSLLPLLFFVGVFIWLGRRARKQITGGIMGFGGSRAKLYDEDRPVTRFADVAGYDGAKAEVQEVVDFLKRPERYEKAGAVGPKGVLLVGPPGTGKTLMARAVAGEAEAPFLALTGLELRGVVRRAWARRVSVTSSRMRGSGRRRSSSSTRSTPSADAVVPVDSPNDEREQTLNQLLSEMDGFDPATGVVVIAATNRVQTLDPALLRPGRFDRTVEIPLPNQAERTGDPGGAHAGHEDRARHGP